MKLSFFVLVFWSIIIGITFAVRPPQDKWQSFLLSKDFRSGLNHQNQNNPEFPVKKNYKYATPSYVGYNIYQQNYGNPFESFGVRKDMTHYLRDSPFWLTKTSYNLLKPIDNKRKDSFILPSYAHTVNVDPYPIHRTIPVGLRVQSFNKKSEDETDVVHRKRFTNKCLDEQLGFRPVKWICGPYFYGEIEKILYNELCEDDKRLIELFYPRAESFVTEIEKCCHVGDPLSCSTDSQKRKDLLAAKYLVHNLLQPE